MPAEAADVGPGPVEDVLRWLVVRAAMLFGAFALLGGLLADVPPATRSFGLVTGPLALLAPVAMVLLHWPRRVQWVVLVLVAAAAGLSAWALWG